MEIVLSEIGLALLLGLVAMITFAVMNFFNYGLKSKSYDDAVAELNKSSGNNVEQKSPKKKSTRKTKKEESSEEEEEQLKKQKPRKVSLAGLKQQQRFKRTESLKNEHVMFADEISADDEKFSPHPVESDSLSSILQNREEVPAIDPTGGEETRNSFEEIQPLDDLQLIRRKSLQLTPTGSLSNSNRGSKTDLTAMEHNWQHQNEEGQDLEQHKEHAARVLKFADEEQQMDVKKVCKILNKLELSDEEIGSLMDILLKKEEQSCWVNKSASKKLSTLGQMRKEVEEKSQLAEESQELATSLQGKLKQLREEKAQVKRELEELKEKAAAEVKSRDELNQRLRAEVEENKQLGQTLTEQQVVIKAALRRIYPAMEVDDDYCQEHQDTFDKFVEKMKNKDSKVVED